MIHYKRKLEIYLTLKTAERRSIIMAYIAESDVDGSWQLNILVTDLQVERTLRVMGDLHIGGVMVRLVDDLGKLPYR